MKYVPPLNGDLEDPDRPWVNADLGSGTKGSYFNAPAAEVTQREILNVIAQAGLVPDGEDLTQLYQAIAALIAAGGEAEFGTEEDIASAATTDLGTATSKVLRITGTTTITSFGAAADVEAPIYLIRFAGNLTLTHNAASLILPGGVNIAAKAGDTALVQYLGAGNWKVLQYTKADGKPVNQSFRGDFPQVTITDTGYTVLPADASKMFALEAATAAVELKLADTAGIYNGFSVLVRCTDDTEGVTVVAYDDSPLAELKTGESVLYIYNGTEWVDFTYQSFSAPPPSFLRQIWGLTLSNNGVDADHDIDIAAGQAHDDTGAVTMTLAAAITKQIDAVWAEGTDAGGLDDGAVANNTFYHVFLIRNSSSGVVDALFSTSFDTPVMPAGYDQKRRIGAVKTDGSANIHGFIQIGDAFIYRAPITDVSTLQPGGNGFEVTRTISVPVGLRVQALLNLNAQGGKVIYAYSPDQTIPAGGISATTGIGQAGANGSGSSGSWGEAVVLTNASAQVITLLGLSSASVNILVVTRGWIDPRGQW